VECNESKFVGKIEINKREVLKMFVKKAFSLLFATTLIFILGVAGVGMAADWGSKELETEKIAVTFAKEVESGGYKIVSTEELKNWIAQKKNMLIVDTMPFEDSYKKQHIPSAINFVFPVPEVKSLDDKTKAAFEKALGTNKDRLIVFYCGFTKCTRSHNGAMWAVKLGYKNVYRYPGGIKAWMEADFSVEKAK
jgi:rhodanese-related sulfurtransferase